MAGANSGCRSCRSIVRNDDRKELLLAQGALGSLILQKLKFRLHCTWAIAFAGFGFAGQCSQSQLFRVRPATPRPAAAGAGIRSPASTGLAPAQRRPKNRPPQTPQKSLSSNTIPPLYSDRIVYTVRLLSIPCLGEAGVKRAGWLPETPPRARWPIGWGEPRCP